ncbi:MAG: hypothetical protein OXP12_00490 [Thaumarchaeota archaeon]|nr:hypothetical protein [Nitrososphaerota archaeon]MDE0525619.1 hypothetical protein [Nitrososphaerota archaeon]
MVSLIKNELLEKVRGAGALTDVDLYKSMTKEGRIIPEDRFNKLLLDLEILGLVKIAWVTKDERRIEAAQEEENDSAGYGDAQGGGSEDGASGGARSKSGSSRGSSASGGNGGGDSDADKSYEASFPGLEK